MDERRDMRERVPSRVPSVFSVFLGSIISDCKDLSFKRHLLEHSLSDYVPRVTGVVMAEFFVHRLWPSAFGDPNYGLIEVKIDGEVTQDGFVKQR